MNRWVILIILLAVVAVVTVAGSMVQRGVSVQLSTVKRGDIREYIDERGKTRVPRVHRITTPQAGRIREITLAEGDSVAQGQAVAQIVSEDLENAVDEARSVVERLSAAIVENDDVAVERSLAVQAGQFVESMNKTVEAAEAQQEASANRAAYGKKQLDRKEQLLQSRAAAEEEYDTAALQYREWQLGSEENRLTVEAIRSIQAATKLLPDMVADYIAHKGLTRAVLEKQKAEAEARLRQIQTQSERGTMNSPIDGVVLQRLIEDEQYLSAGTPLLTIGQLDQLEVETDVLSQDVVRVQPGDAAEVYGPAVGGGVGDGVPGVVDKIYPAGFTKVSSLGVEQQRVKVIVRLAPEVIRTLLATGVGVDYSVRVRIFTQQKSQALLVPRSCLFRGPEGGWQLFVAVGRRAALRNVTVGLMNESSAEITDGLAEGDRVILAPETSLAHGTRIKAVPK